MTSGVPASRRVDLPLPSCQARHQRQTSHERRGGHGRQGRGGRGAGCRWQWGGVVCVWVCGREAGRCGERCMWSCGQAGGTDVGCCRKVIGVVTRRGVRSCLSRASPGACELIVTSSDLSTRGQSVSRKINRATRTSVTSWCQEREKDA